MQLKLMTMAIGRSVNDRVGRSQLVSQVDNSPLGHIFLATQIENPLRTRSVRFSVFADVASHRVDVLILSYGPSTRFRGKDGEQTELRHGDNES